MTTQTPKRCCWVNVKSFTSSPNRNWNNCTWSNSIIEVTANGLCKLLSFFSYAIASLPGEPTLAEKAKNFIDSLGLGNRPEAAVVNTVHFSLVPTDNTTIPRQRRQSGLPVACPASQKQQKVCTDITGKHKVILWAVHHGTSKDQKWNTYVHKDFLQCS